MNFTLKVLGTASALPTIDRFPSAQVLDVHGRLFLIDCGEGAQMQMRRMGVSFLKIENVCISHIHGDHLFGLFGLFSTMGMLGRTGDLTVFAPRAFGPVLKFFLSYFGEGMKFRIVHKVLDMKEPELIYENRTIEILSFPLRHRIDTFGFLFREKEPTMNVRKEAISEYGLGISEIAALKRGEDVVRPAGPDAEPSVANGFVRCSGTDEPLVIKAEDAAYRPFVPRSYAYCSDTAPFPELAQWIHGVDMLYHEATFPDEMAEMAAKTFHSTTSQAAECAKKAGAGRLLIGHYSSRYHDIGVFEKEASAIFPETSAVKEGDIFEIPLARLR